MFAKAEQLRLPGTRHEVLRPGLRGGRFYITTAGKVRYDEPPHVRTRAIETRDPERVMLFRSGASDVTPIAAYARAGAPIGVEIHNVSKRGRAMLADYVNEGGSVFVDSGAFPAFKRGEPLSEEDFEEVLDRYEQLVALVEPAGRGRLFMVAPDVVSDQAATLERLGYFADRVRTLIEQGVSVLVPIQKGALPLAEAYRQTVERLGTRLFVVSLPSNEAAVTLDEALAFAREVKPSRLHLLGIGESKALEERRKEIQAVSPETEITADANRYRRIVGYLGSGKPRLLTGLVNRAAEAEIAKLHAPAGLTHEQLLREIRPALRVRELARLVEAGEATRRADETEHALANMRAMAWGLLKASQLGLFRKPVEKPGSKGGKFYYDRYGHVVYGERPTGMLVEHEHIVSDTGHPVPAPPIPDLKTYDWIVVNISGGKDSQAMLDYVVELADKAGVPRAKIVAVNEDLGEAEWPGASDIAKRQAEHYGVRFEKVARPTGHLLEHIEQRGKWPGPGLGRYCTSQHKTAQAAKLITALSRETREKEGKAQPRILQCRGIRALESPARSKDNPLCPDPTSTGAKHVDSWLPIFDWTADRVWHRIEASGVEHHYAYDAGFPRLSCRFCVMQPFRQSVLAGLIFPELLDKEAAMEQRMAAAHPDWPTAKQFQERYSLAQVKQACAAMRDKYPEIRKDPRVAYKYVTKEDTDPFIARPKK